MAALVGIAAHLGAVLAPHVAFEFMDRGCLRSPHDVEGDGLVRVAAEALHFEVDEPRIARIAQRRRWLRRPLKAEHALIPTASRSAVLRAPVARSAAAGPIRRKWSRVICSPCNTGCAGLGDIGKSLEIAGINAPDTQQWRG
jgi:hypothetical protein